MADPDPEQITALLAAFDRDPDPLHGDITPSVLKLIGLRLDGALAACSLLNSPQSNTRYRARHVVEGAVGLYLGRRFGQPFPDEQTEQRVRAIITENAYDPDAPEPQRLQAIERWRSWLGREMQRRRDE
jgi:hypothetical protein